MEMVCFMKFSSLASLDDGFLLVADHTLLALRRQVTRQVKEGASTQGG